MSFLSKFRSSSSTSTKDQNNQPDPSRSLTPLQRLSHQSGPLQQDGCDRVYGLENFGNTCYCNSILQALYYSEFRRNILAWPCDSYLEDPGRPRIEVSLRITADVAVNAQKASKTPNISATGHNTRYNATPVPTSANGTSPSSPAPAPRAEDKPGSAEFKKKQALARGPVIELQKERATTHGMPECAFTALRDVFLCLLESSSKTGVLSPRRFLDVFKRDNELFRNSMHQDAHEFYGILVNSIISSVDSIEYQQAMDQCPCPKHKGQGSLTQSTPTTPSPSTSVPRSKCLGAVRRSWVHELLEGNLSSETRCMMCERVSRKDEVFFDLSLDLEQSSSVTASLRNFSADEVMCERNKFQCEHCGGYQESEKRMVIRKSPRLLALHLKRFKYADDFSQLLKVHHRVTYPLYMRIATNPTATETYDRFYELHAVIVHIGQNAYQGHYVSIVKTLEYGWLLFDDELVETVPRQYVRQFHGQRHQPVMASAYLLLYQECSFDHIYNEIQRHGESLTEIETVDLRNSSTRKEEPLSTPTQPHFGTTVATPNPHRPALNPVSEEDEEMDKIRRETSYNDIKKPPDSDTVPSPTPNSGDETLTVVSNGKKKDVDKAHHGVDPDKGSWTARTTKKMKPPPGILSSLFSPSSSQPSESSDGPGDVKAKATEKVDPNNDKKKFDKIRQKEKDIAKREEQRRHKKELEKAQKQRKLPSSASATPTEENANPLKSSPSSNPLTSSSPTDDTIPISSFAGTLALDSPHIDKSVPKQSIDEKQPTVSASSNFFQRSGREAMLRSRRSFSFLSSRDRAQQPSFNSTKVTGTGPVVPEQPSIVMTDADNEPTPLPDSMPVHSTPSAHEHGGSYSTSASSVSSTSLRGSGGHYEDSTSATISVSYSRDSSQPSPDMLPPPLQVDTPNALTSTTTNLDISIPNADDLQPTSIEAKQPLEDVTATSPRTELSERLRERFSFQRGRRKLSMPRFRS